jgi:tyrosyl-DNA phosphodiesterase-1
MILATLRGPPQDDTDPEATDSDTDPDATDPDSSDIEVVEIKPKRTEADEEEKRKPHGWIYVGSHNFTPSTWGSMTGSGFSPVLTVRGFCCTSRLLSKY